MYIYIKIAEIYSLSGVDTNIKVTCCMLLMRVNLQLSKRKKELFRYCIPICCTYTLVCVLFVLFVLFISCGGGGGCVFLVVSQMFVLPLFGESVLARLS